RMSEGGPINTLKHYRPAASIFYPIGIMNQSLCEQDNSCDLLAKMRGRFFYLCFIHSLAVLKIGQLKQNHFSCTSICPRKNRGIPRFHFPVQYSIRSAA